MAARRENTRQLESTAQPKRLSLDPTTTTRELVASVETAYRKLLWKQALGASSRGAMLVIGVLCVLTGLRRFGLVPFSIVPSVALICVVALAVVAGRALRGVTRMQAALAIDRKFAFEGRFAAAYEFSGREADNGYLDLVLREVAGLYPFRAGEAVVVQLRRQLTPILGLLLMLAVVSILPLPRRSARPPQPALASPSASRLLSEDDAELLRRRAEELKAKVRSEQGKQFADQYNDLVIRLSEGSLSQSEGFKVAAALAARLEEGAKEADALAQGLIQRGELLRKKHVTETAGRALAEGRFADAQEALKILAERLQAGAEGLSQRELNELRESLEQVRNQNVQESQSAQEKERDSSASEPRRAALEKQRDDLQKKKAEGKASTDDLTQLAETERELKRLDRQRKEQPASAADQQLSELDQKLAEAARALAEQRKKSGEFLEEAAAQVGKAAARSLSDEEKKELIKQLEALKERLRDQAKEGGQDKRMKDFQRRARGQSGEQGEGQEGQGQQGEEGKGAQQAQVTLAPGGTPLPVPEAGSEPGQGQGQEEGKSSGQEAGHDHDENLTSEPERLANKGYLDKAAAGQDSGQGKSASETIASAAERGFASGSYQKLYLEYETVAEEVMEKERIPPGRRSHIRRYFELIRPREKN